MSDAFVDPAARLILLVIALFMLLWAVVLVLCPTLVMVYAAAVIFGHHRAEQLFLQRPLLMYMIRVSGALYGWMGASFLIAARDPARYRDWTRLAGVMLALIGCCCMISGWLYGLPRFMYVGDALLAWTGAFFVLRFALPPRRPDQTGED